mmetsp:Transcript_6905/g.17342  ORF Transcript_6905/g.17342 Transcript_6905/m.17342 type:complete len:224 (-) Transcript_6905:317-988(-)
MTCSTCSPKPRRAQIRSTRSMRPSASPARTPKVRLAYRLPWKKSGSQQTWSTRRCEGTKMMFVTVSWTIMSPINLSSVDFPSPCGPTSTTNWPCAISREPSNFNGATRFSSFLCWLHHFKSEKSKLVTVIGMRSIGQVYESSSMFAGPSAGTTSSSKAFLRIALVSSRRHRLTCMRCGRSMRKFRIATSRSKAVKHRWMSTRTAWTSAAAWPTQTRTARSVRK